MLVCDATKEKIDAFEGFCPKTDVFELGKFLIDRHLRQDDTRGARMY